MGKGISFRHGLYKPLTALIVINSLLFSCVSTGVSFTRVQAIDLQRRLVELEKLDNPDGANLFTVAREMNRETRSRVGPHPMNFSDSVMLRLETSFGSGKDSASLDLVSVKDIGYGEMLEGGLPFITYQRDNNPGIFANYSYNHRDGLNLDSVQFAEMVGGAPVLATSYVVGGILLATAGVAIAAAGSGGYSGTPQTQAEGGQQTAQTPAATGQTTPVLTTEEQPASGQSPAEQPEEQQSQTGAVSVTNPQSNPEETDQDNNRDGEKNQPQGIGTGFDDAHDKKDKDDAGDA